MEAHSELRKELFATLMRMPSDRWPGNDDDLFDCGLDSIRVMRLLVLIEERFGVILPDEAVTPESIGSVNSLADTIAKYGAA